MAEQRKNGNKEWKFNPTMLSVVKNKIRGFIKLRKRNKDSDTSTQNLTLSDSDNSADLKNSTQDLMSLADHTVGKNYIAKIGNVPTTFNVFDIQPNRIYGMEFARDPNTAKGFRKIERLEIFNNSYISHVLQGSEIYDETIGCKNIKTTHNGFMDSIIQSYVGHHNIIIRPDDVWLAIIIQFSFYVNANSEKLRRQFVTFDKKKTLTVSLIELDGVNAIPYGQFVSLMTKLVDKNLVDSEVKDWILPNFSTTTADDRLTAGVALMATMKNYFKYRGRWAGCGIPEVTLEGSVKDWIDIRTRIGKLREYDLNDWVDMLEPILEQFVRAKSGDIDLGFWKNIVHHDFQEGVGWRYEPDRTFISGWVTAFCPFSKDGHNWHSEWQKSKGDLSDSDDPKNSKINSTWPQIEMKNIAVGYVDVPVTWEVVNFDETVGRYETVFLGGHMAMEALPGRLTLQPRSGWVIALLKDGYKQDISKESSVSDSDTEE